MVVEPSGCVRSPSQPREMPRTGLNREGQAWRDSPKAPGKGRGEWPPRAPGQGLRAQEQGKEGRGQVWSEALVSLF